ncbi:PrsW family intramembrane metalloprotease [Halocatena pleomorpha]|uniref:PrsW family intramembrane metalloprotease n=1 Tax=Halocatena pleomorpha TaxID=1785090 RepID=A0A3P3RM74_9EURY|nr:PrsW family glutamic-type intramembrane protease [Halocatena pleomorpha]RRJ33493.1 PrsW family intramembrane metalloprotease [Halocatena pleomorpha]
MADRDPLERLGNQSRDLYDVATWEPRTALDRLASKLYRWGIVGVRWGTVLIALLLTLGILYASFRDLRTKSVPVIGVLTVLSALPALAIVVYVYASDVTASEPVDVVASTFVLGVLFAGLAALIEAPFSAVLGGPIGTILMYYLIVGPVEEFVKLCAVWLFAYRQPSFDAVIDGAVYGAVAGLGFATIENALYIGVDLARIPAETMLQTVTARSDITATRALAGPGHVIYSAFAGYYLGLARFNLDDAGPIVVKGLLIAVFIHATYNTLSTLFIGTVTAAFPTVPTLIPFFVFVLVYLGFFGYLLFRKLDRYRRLYAKFADETDENGSSLTVARTEFDE